MLRTQLVAGFTLAFALSATSCLFYDSRWGEAKRAQKRYVAAETPVALHTAEASPSNKLRRRDSQPTTLGAHVYATQSYAAQLVDWQRDVREIVEDSNKILEQELNIHVVVESTGAWNGASDGDSHLDNALKALRSKDSGKDSNFVIGLIGGLPKTKQNFHDLGMAESPGKYIVLRAAASIDEHDAIEKGLDEIDADERARLRQARRRHRAAAVFLHEVGHALGAIHESNRQSIMHTTYGRAMESFSPEAVSLMRVTLDYPAASRPADFAKTRLDVLQNTSTNTWVSSDRDDTIKRLRAYLDGVTAPAPGGPTATTIQT